MSKEPVGAVALLNYLSIALDAEHAKVLNPSPTSGQPKVSKPLKKLTHSLTLSPSTADAPARPLRSVRVNGTCGSLPLKPLFKLSIKRLRRLPSVRLLAILWLHSPPGTPCALCPVRGRLCVSPSGSRSFA